MPDSNPMPERPPGPAGVEYLTASQYAEWIQYLKDMMRHDLAEAEAHSDAWESEKARLERDVLKEKGMADKVILRSWSKQSVVLSDEMDAWSFFERRAKLYAAVLEAEMATRLGGFGL